MALPSPSSLLLTPSLSNNTSFHNDTQNPRILTGGSVHSICEGVRNPHSLRQLDKAPRGREPKYSTEEEMAAAKQRRTPRDSENLKPAETESEQAHHISTATSEEEASRAGQATRPT